jgi:hypothetical protein
MQRHLLITSQLLLVFGLVTTPARAQGARPTPILEAGGGYVGFLDDGGAIGHAGIGGGARLFLTGRLAAGPEVAYLRGPGRDHDVLITANVAFDLLRERHGEQIRRVVPYAVGSTGQERHWGNYMPRGRTSVAGFITSFGGGARVAISPRVFVAPEFRVGIEPHVRFCVSIGVRPGRI